MAAAIAVVPLSAVGLFGQSVSGDGDEVAQSVLKLPDALPPPPQAGAFRSAHVTFPG